MRLIKVLYVEDDPLQRSLLRQMLKASCDYMFYVDCVESLDAAARHINFATYDMVLADYHLGVPVAQTDALLRELRAQSARLPVAIISGSPLEELSPAVRDAVADGSLYYLAKQSLSVARLGQLVEELLGTELRVLLLEDDADDYHLTERYLGAAEPYSFSICWCRTLQQARAALAESRFDILIADLCLPDGDGLELLREVLDSGAGTALALVTGQERYQLSPEVEAWLASRRVAFARKRELSGWYLADLILKQTNQVRMEETGP